ncbi:MAG: thioredoxin domain-containing protein [Balneolaceae bacterium]
MNRLQYEKSPYLLQHKNNPVDWYPWGDEAFAKAKAESKPIFLSIGYATCHWCHVMEHESFEDDEIAALLNNAFINIKVDREERPDIDSTYMLVCQMLNGHGGWPLTIIMTPEKKPFFAATYLPKEARFNRIGLRQLIPGVLGMWKHEPAKVQKAVESIESGFAKSQEFESGVFPGTEAIDFAAAQLAQQYDDKHGGFGGAPKFPSPHNLMFLLRQWHHTRDDRFKIAVEQTLTEMRLGGIWDHVGLGFHRYSTDEKWLLPHFEKMLYDQALLMMAYTEGWQVCNNPLFEQTVSEIAQYVERELTHSHGGFYSAEDADTEGEEGKFYIWTENEIESLLSEDDALWLKKKLNFKEEGNFEDEATKQLTGANIPHLKKPLNKIDSIRFKEIRNTLFKARDNRTRPLLDDKILTDWNALMVVALAKAGAVFQNETYLETAEKAFQFLMDNLFDNDVLKHRYKDGSADINAFADDYAFMVWAGIELYEATFNSNYLVQAQTLNDAFIEHCWDNEAGGFYLTKDKTDQALGLQKQIFDGAIPSANSVGMLNLLRLGRITGDTKLEEMANKIGECFSSELIRSGSSITLAMCALQFVFHNAKEVIISEGEDDVKPITSVLQTTFNPQKVVVYRPRKEDAIFTLAPYIAALEPVNNQSSVYICTNYTCEFPITDVDALKESLNR